MTIERPVFTPPFWHTGETAEQIQARMMQKLPADIDNIEGGFPFDFTMPTALEEDELMNFVLIEAIKLIFPAWSYGTYLDYHAARCGLTRRPGNHASGYVTISGVPGTAIAAGTVFCVPAVNDVPAIEYATSEAATIGEAEEGGDYGKVTVGVTAVEAGLGSNVSADTIVIMATPIKGVVNVTNEAAITGGTEEEDDDSLYERIVLTEQDTEGYVGNDSDYIRWAKEVNGVGTVLVDTQYEEDHPNWVKLIILDVNGQPANDQILAAVYEHIMGPENRAEDRLAPIGAILIVEAPAGCGLVIQVTGLELAEGATTDDVIKAFKDSLETYYTTAKEDAEVRWNVVHALFTETEGVEDFATLTINGGTVNIPIAADDYPVTDEVMVE